jgi:hypothetical protein
VPNPSSLELIALLSFFAARSLGLELLLNQQDRNLWIRETVARSIVLETSDFCVNPTRAVIQYPAVQMFTSQLNRWEGGTNLTGSLKPAMSRCCR